MKLIHYFFFIVIVPWNVVPSYGHRGSSIGRKRKKKSRLVDRIRKLLLRAEEYEEPRGNSKMAAEERREATTYENLKVSSPEDHPSI